MADIVHFTDPGCPFAWSAEPRLLRLRWLFGDALRWTTRMVVLADSGGDYEAKGMTAERSARSFARLSERYGMPMDTRPRTRMAGTAPACRAYVAVREHGTPEEAVRLLRALRVGQFSGRLLDEPGTIARAARDAGLDPAALEAWIGLTSLDEDRRLARTPHPSALALTHRLAPAGDGWRYTCPSLEITEDGMTIVAPGFQPFEVYEVALAHVAPGLERRDDADGVEEVLDWAPYPLATQEVAVLLGEDREVARERLREAGATEHPLGTDAFWTAA